MSKKIAYLKQKWTSKSVIIPIEKFKAVSKVQMIMAMNYIGQEFIKKARDKSAGGGNYDDQTGNLRSSIGYAIFDNGKEINSIFEIADKDEKGAGVKSAKKLAKEQVAKTGLCLIVTAGMNYAAAVESKNYTVLTAFAPSENEVKRDLEKLLKYVM